MPRYSRTTCSGELFEFECSWKIIPETVGELIKGLQNGDIKPFEMELEKMLKALKKYKHSNKLEWCVEKQKPTSHLINWIPTEKL